MADPTECQNCFSEEIAENGPWYCLDCGNQWYENENMNTKGLTVREVCEQLIGYSLEPMAYRIWWVDPNELYDVASKRLRDEEEHDAG